METKLAPARATIYIGQLEKTFLASRAIKLALWVRYINDVFAVWPHPLNEFDKFLAELNNMRDRINFTAELAHQSCNYLITIFGYKSPSFQETGLLSTTIYYKPTNTFSFP